MKKLYEAMFIVDPNKSKESYEAIEAVCLNCITRHGAEIVKSQKWDERKLAYDINNCRRGLYILVHFNADPQAIAKIERQARITENILRVQILVDTDGIETKTGAAKERADAELENFPSFIMEDE